MKEIEAKTKNLRVRLLNMKNFQNFKAQSILKKQNLETNPNIKKQPQLRVRLSRTPLKCSSQINLPQKNKAQQLRVRLVPMSLKELLKFKVIQKYKVSITLLISLVSRCRSFSVRRKRIVNKVRTEICG